MATGSFLLQHNRKLPCSSRDSPSFAFCALPQHQVLRCASAVSAGPPNGEAARLHTSPQGKGEDDECSALHHPFICVALRVFSENGVDAKQLPDWGCYLRQPVQPLCLHRPQF